MQILCDFDGTISTQDSTDAILQRFALPEWEWIEAQWKQGVIGSAECMKQQIAMIRASKEELDQILDTLTIDPGFTAFLQFCRSLHIPVTIISDGVDYFIQRILHKYRLDNLPVIANRLITADDNHYSLACPYHNPACASGAGVCKCKYISACNGMRMFVGDGRSDFCAAESADLLFAKHSLATYCDQRDIPYLDYTTFHDVQSSLEHILSAFALPKSIGFAYASA